MVVFDANFLIYFLDPKIKGGVGSNPRIDQLVATIQKTVSASLFRRLHSASYL